MGEGEDAPLARQAGPGPRQLSEVMVEGQVRGRTAGGWFDSCCQLQRSWDDAPAGEVGERTKPSNEGESNGCADQGRKKLANSVELKGRAEGRARGSVQDPLGATLRRFSTWSVLQAGWVYGAVSWGNFRFVNWRRLSFLEHSAMSS